MIRAPPLLPVPVRDQRIFRQPPEPRMILPDSGLAAMKLMNSWRSVSDQIGAAYRMKIEVSATVRMPHYTALPYLAQVRQRDGCP